jgi:hypothetical protein
MISPDQTGQLFLNRPARAMKTAWWREVFPENLEPGALVGIIASLTCWWLSVRDPAKPFIAQA